MQSTDVRAKPSSARPGNVVRFVLDDTEVAVRVIDPTRTVLQFLREDSGRTGTKEGCAEGDCGAWTVVIAEPVTQPNVGANPARANHVGANHAGAKHSADPRLCYRAVNACIQFLPTLDGKALITVESLKNRHNGALHPVQQALADGLGSQCGFCTPGFVMSLFALYKSAIAPTRAEINDALAGNLCRCTGYRPIVDAAGEMLRLGAAIPADMQDYLSATAASQSAAARTSELALIAKVHALRRPSGLMLRGTAGAFFAPRTTQQFAKLREGYPDARILAGGTDVGLWVTKQHRRLPEILYIGNVAELKQIRIAAGQIAIGAAVTLSDAFAVLEKHYPSLREMGRRFASPPIRNAGTLVGNIANGSPIGDAMPALISLGSRLVLRKAQTQRELALEDLYLDYQQTALMPGEFVERVLIPLPKPDFLYATYKISKRFDQDISAVCVSFAVQLADDTVHSLHSMRSVGAERSVRSVRIACGGVAAIPKRALACEAVLTGRRWDPATCDDAALALAQDYSPITDMRASASYRLRVVQNLLRKFYLETSGQLGTAPSRLYDFALTELRP